MIRFSDALVVESDELKAGVILDFDEHENVVKIEVLDASERVSLPTKLEYELAMAS